MKKIFFESKFKNIKYEIRETEEKEQKGWIFGYIKGKKEILAMYSNSKPKNKVIETCIKACKRTIAYMISQRYMERYNFSYVEKIIWKKPKNIKRKYFKKRRKK